MTKAERGQLIRKIFSAKDPRKVRPKCEPRPRPAPRVYRNRFSFGTLNTVTQCNWVKQPDEPKSLVLKIPAQQVVSALTRIAEKWRPAPK